MKKLFFVALASAFLFVACSSVDSLISKYEKACEEGNAIEAAKIALEINDEIGGDETKLSKEQAERLEKASEKLSGAFGF